MIEFIVGAVLSVAAYKKVKTVEYFVDNFYNNTLNKYKESRKLKLENAFNKKYKIVQIEDEHYSIMKKEFALSKQYFDFSYYDSSTSITWETYASGRFNRGKCFATLEKTKEVHEKLRSLETDEQKLKIVEIT